MRRNIFSPTSLIVLIAFAAFLGFGSLFEQFGEGIGVQSTAAAFSALFVILSTKILLQQEQELQRLNEQRKEDAERKRKVFETRINVYQKAAFQISEVLENDKVSINDIHKFRMLALELQLVAGPKTLVQFNVFSSKALEFLQESLTQARLEEAKSSMPEESDSFSFPLSDTGRKEIWGAVANFLNSCREDLDLSQEKIGSDFSNQFNTLLNSFSAADIQAEEVLRTVRTPLEGGIKEWVSKKFPKENLNTLVPKVEGFVLEMLDNADDLVNKVTATQITIRKNSARSHRKVVVYFMGMKDRNFIIGFNISEASVLKDLREKLLAAGIEVGDEDKKASTAYVPENYSADQMKAVKYAIRVSADLII